MGDRSSESYDLSTTIVDMLPFGVYVVDTGNHELLYVNRHYQERLRKVRDRRCWQALFQQEKPRLNCNIPELSDAGEGSNHTIAYDKFDEVDERWYHLNSVLPSALLPSRWWVAKPPVWAWRPGAPADDEEALLKRADEALYQTKEAGRNRVVAETPPADQPTDGSRP